MMEILLKKSFAGTKSYYEEHEKKGLIDNEGIIVYIAPEDKKKLYNAMTDNPEFCMDCLLNNFCSDDFVMCD